MMTISKFSATFMLSVFTFGILSCSGDKNDGGGTTTGEFFEITVDGKTKTTKLNVTSVSTSGEFNYIQSYDVEGVEFMLITYSDLGKLASSSDRPNRYSPMEDDANFPKSEYVISVNSTPSTS